MSNSILNLVLVDLLPSDLASDRVKTQEQRMSRTEGKAGRRYLCGRVPQRDL